MRLYNTGSCTPWAAKPTQSPPRNFLPPKQSDGFAAWKSNKDQHLPITRSFGMGGISKHSAWGKRNSTKPTESLESSSPSTTSFTADLSPEVHRPAQSGIRYSPVQITKMLEEEIVDTLPALRDLDTILMQVSLMAGEQLIHENDGSSLTTMSTLSTKGSIDRVTAAHEFKFSFEEQPENLHEKHLAASHFSGNIDLKWPPMKASRVQASHGDPPWPSEPIHDDALGLNDQSPTMLFANDAPRSKQTYTNIRAGLRKVETKTPPPNCLKADALPTQEASWASKQTSKPSRDPFRRKSSPQMMNDFNPFESLNKEIKPGMFDGAFDGTFSLTRHLEITFDDEAGGNKFSTSDEETGGSMSYTPETSNLRGRRNEQDNRSPRTSPTKKVLFRIPEESSNFPVDRPLVPFSDSKKKQSPTAAVQDDPRYAKYFHMIKMGLPIGAVKNALKMDGHDPAIIDGDTANPAPKPRLDAIPAPKAVGDKIRHFRIHWETHNEVRSNSVWAMVKRDPDVSNLEVSDHEMRRLFRIDATSQKKAPAPSSSRGNEHTAVKVIDSKRANNGGITLARVKLTYGEIARAVDNFDQDVITPEQIRGIINFIPTQDERAALRVYLDKPGGYRTQLCECEKFMVAMMGVKHAKRKLSAIQFMQSFATCLEDLRRDARLVQKACDEIMSSSRFRKILGIVLTLGNRLNTAGSNGKEPAEAIALESLLKLNQAKSFDRQTTFLHFVIMSIRRNKASLIHYKDDLPSLFKAEKMQWSLVVSEMQRMEKGVDEVRKIALHYSQVQAGLAVDDAVTLSSSIVPLAREVELLQTTSVGHFTLDACLRMAVLVNEVDKAKDSCEALFEYFGDQRKTQPDMVFRTVCTFGRNFDRALEEVIAQEKAKVREMRGVPLVRCETKSFDEVEDSVNVKHQALMRKRSSGDGEGSTVKSDRKRSAIKSKGKFRWGRRNGKQI